MKNRRALIFSTVFFVMFLGVIASVNPLETRVLETISDSSIKEMSPNSNFGNFWKLEVSSATSSPRKIIAYIMFDLKVIQGSIESAEFRLFCTNLTETHEIEVFFCLDNSWTETGITWNNAPPVELESVGSLSVTDPLEWYGFDVTGDVKKVSGTSSQKMTFVLVSTTTTENGFVEFYAKDGIGGLRPSIDIEFEAKAEGPSNTFLIQVIAILGIVIGAGALAYFKFFRKPSIEKTAITEKTSSAVAEKTTVGAVGTPGDIEGSRASVMFHHVGGIMVEDFGTIEYSKTVSNANKLMIECNTEHLVVLKNGEPIGILTEHDVFRRVFTKNLKPEDVSVEKVMSKPLITLSPSDDIEEAAKLMVTHHIRKLPIIEGNKLVGMVSEAELVKTLWNLLFLLP